MEDKLIEAINGNDVEAVRLLLSDPRVDPSASDNFALRQASAKGHAEVVRLLLSDPRVDPSAYDNFALRQASLKGYTEVVRLLIKDGRADPRADNNYAIQKASDRGRTEVVRLLLEDGRADPSASDNFALRQASAKGHIEVVRLLLKDGRADPNEGIFWSLYNGHVEIASLLLSDPRVDYIIDDRHEKLKQAKQKILLKERNKLRNELVSKYQSISQASPQIKIEDQDYSWLDWFFSEDKVKIKSQIPKEIIRKTVYQSVYQELCSIIPKKFPTPKLLALADLLKIKYIRTTSYAELCGKVKLVLLHL